MYIGTCEIPCLDGSSCMFQTVQSLAPSLEDTLSFCRIIGRVKLLSKRTLYLTFQDCFNLVVVVVVEVVVVAVLGPPV